MNVNHQTEIIWSTDVDFVVRREPKTFENKLKFVFENNGCLTMCVFIQEIHKADMKGNTFFDMDVLSSAF